MKSKNKVIQIDLGRLPGYDNQEDPGFIIRIPRKGTASILARGLKTAGDPDSTAEIQFNAATDGIEILVLAHAVAGVDVKAPAYIEGLRQALSQANGNI